MSDIALTMTTMMMLMMTMICMIHVSNDSESLSVQCYLLIKQQKSLTLKNKGRSPPSSDLILNPSRAVINLE